MLCGKTSQLINVTVFSPFFPSSELVPPQCTQCNMPKSTNVFTATYTYVDHSQHSGSERGVPRCSMKANLAEKGAPLWTGYSLMQITDENSLTTVDLGSTASCMADFSQASISGSGNVSSVWLAGRGFDADSSVSLETAGDVAISRCSVCSSRYPVVVVHGSEKDGEKAPKCPGVDSITLWHGYSVMSISRHQDAQQIPLSTSTGSCLPFMPDDSCSIECNSLTGDCRATTNGKWLVIQ